MSDQMDIVLEARKTWWEIVESDAGECRLMGIVRELADEVERLRKIRPAVIEECAKVACDTTGAVARGDFGLIGPAGIGMQIAAAIRALPAESAT